MLTTLKCVSINALLATISVCLALVSHQVALPAQMFNPDFSDTPIFVAMFLFGTSSGILILFVVSFIRAIFFSVAGWTGLVMRMVTSLSILIMGYCTKNNKNFHIASAISAILTTLVKIPVSYVFWTKFHSMPPVLIKSILFSQIIPYNFLKIVINIYLAKFLYEKIKKSKL